MALHLFADLQAWQQQPSRGHNSCWRKDSALSSLKWQSTISSQGRDQGKGAENSPFSQYRCPLGCELSNALIVCLVMKRITWPVIGKEKLPFFAGGCCIEEPQSSPQSPISTPPPLEISSSFPFPRAPVGPLVQCIPKRQPGFTLLTQIPEKSSSD